MLYTQRENVALQEMDHDCARVICVLPPHTPIVLLAGPTQGRWCLVKAPGMPGGPTGAVRLEQIRFEEHGGSERSPDPVPGWMFHAWGELGVAEVAGLRRNNPRIMEYHATTGNSDKNDELPWCSSFANWCMMKAGIVGTLRAGARTWSHWGHELRIPRPGCVVVFKRLDSTHGHVAFFVRSTSQHIFVLGGNQDNRVCVKAREWADVINFRWPGAGPSHTPSHRLLPGHGRHAPHVHYPSH